jgi:hypothetical protein
MKYILQTKHKLKVIIVLVLAVVIAVLWSLYCSSFLPCESSHLCIMSMCYGHPKSVWTKAATSMYCPAQCLMFTSPHPCSLPNVTCLSFKSAWECIEKPTEKPLSIFHWNMHPLERKRELSGKSWHHSSCTFDLSCKVARPHGIWLVQKVINHGKMPTQYVSKKW